MSADPVVVVDAPAAVVPDATADEFPKFNEPPHVEGKIFPFDSVRRDKIKFIADQLAGTTSWAALAAARKRRQEKKVEEDRGGDAEAPAAAADAEEKKTTAEEPADKKKDTSDDDDDDDDDDDNQEDFDAAELVPPREIAPERALSLWLDLCEATTGTEAPNNLPVIDGRKFSRRRAAHEALKLDEACSRAWMWLSLATVGDDTEVVCVTDTDEHKVLSSRGAAPADVNKKKLQQLPGGPSAKQNKNKVAHKFTFRDSMLTALELDTTGEDWYIWMHAGIVLSEEEGDYLTVRGRPYRSEDCYRIAAERGGEQKAVFWHKVCNNSPSGEWKYKGHSYSLVEMATRAADLDPTHGMAWMRIAELLEEGETVVVRGVSYDRVQCSVQGVLMCGNSDSYTALGHYANVDNVAVTYVEGKGLTMRDCFARAVELDDTSPWAYNNLGFALSVSGEDPDVPCIDTKILVNGRLVGCLECYVAALALENDAIFWSNICECLQVQAHPTRSVMISGYQYEAKDLSVDLDPTSIHDLAAPNPRRTNVCRSFD